MVYAGTLAAAALSRLLAAVTAAADGDPLKGFVLPGMRQDWANRWQQVPVGILSAMTVHATGERSEGTSRQLPEFDVVASLHINGFVSLGREDGIDLDTLGLQVIAAVLDVLLEDSTFLQLFGWVENVDWKTEDAAADKNANQFDTLVFRIELELAGGLTLYTPRVPADPEAPGGQSPLTTADVTTTNGAAVVESRIPLPE
jgi:hypothetical protein